MSRQESWRDEPNPVASPDAVAGGELVYFAGPYPKSFNYYLENSSFCADLFSLTFDCLLTIDPVTSEYVPGLAVRWAISDDRKSFTFWLDPSATWSDGKPVTGDDVVWTFQAILNPTNLTGVHKVSLSTFDVPEVLEDGAVRFKAKEVHWRNLGAAGGFHVLPKHVFADRDFNKIHFEFPVVSGLYRLGEVKEGIYAKLYRRADAWARGRVREKSTGNFGTIVMRFYAERENAFEEFKKGNIDVFPVYTARSWVKETDGEKFSSNWIVKQKVYNHAPMGFQGFVMNMRRPPFDDLRVRKAMACLVNRAEMNRTIMYSQYFLYSSYYQDLYTAARPCTNEVFQFDKERARKLLAEAGWVADPKTGLLQRDGKPFSFRFLNRDQSSGKFLTIFQEDLKDVGVEMTLDVKDWASWVKDMDDLNFDMTWAAWSAGLFKDPEGMWASTEADRKSGNNYAGFKNARVDELIEKQKGLFDVERRNEIVREIDAILAGQVPYVLLWGLDYQRLLYWNKFGTPRTVLDKYGSESALLSYWWLDEDSEAGLRDAMKNGTQLPARPAEVRFDEFFGK